MWLSQLLQTLGAKHILVPPRLASFVTMSQCSRMVTPTQFLRLCFLVIVCLIRKWVSIYRENRIWNSRMKPFLIIPCYRALLRVALLECAGGRGFYFAAAVYWEIHFLLNILSGTIWNPAAVNPLHNKGLKARYSKNVCLNQEACVRSAALTGNLIHSRHHLRYIALWERAHVNLSQKQRESKLDMLCRIC